MENNNECECESESESESVNECENENTKSPRCAIQIAISFIPLIPQSETKLLEDLTVFISKYLYTPPEFTRTDVCWIPFQKIMANNIKNNNEEWQNKLLQIFNRTT